MRWLFLLLGLTIQLNAKPLEDIIPSTPEEIASLSTDLIVDGYVSAMSGQYPPEWVWWN